MIQSPVYYPFSQVIVSNGRKLVTNDLVQAENGAYQIDFDDFENKIVTEKVKLFLLCNPHNPVGRVWTKEELTRLGDICLKHKVIVVSDEIHADFSYERKHNVFVNVKEAYQEIGIVCTSPSKTFNIAGFQVSNIFIANETLRKEFAKQIDASGYSQLKLEGTYLVWLDFRAYGLSDKEIDRRIIHEAGLWLDSGRIFGKPGVGFQRINIACPRKTLEQALERLAVTFADID